MASSQTKRPDPLTLPTYPIMPDQNFTQYLKNFTSNLQWWGDQITQAVNNGLLPIQSVTIAATVSNGATGQNFTFVPSLPTGTNYTVLAMPHWNAGGVWLTPTSVASFTLNWNTTPSTTSTIDFVVALTGLFA